METKNGPLVLENVNVVCPNVAQWMDGPKHFLAKDENNLEIKKNRKKYV